MFRALRRRSPPEETVERLVEGIDVATFERIAESLESAGLSFWQERGLAVAGIDLDGMAFFAPVYSVRVRAQELAPARRAIAGIARAHSQAVIGATGRNGSPVFVLRLLRHRLGALRSWLGPRRGAAPGPRVLRRAGDLADLIEDRLRVSVDGSDILLLRVGDRVVALNDRCPHGGSSLSRGRVFANVIECAGHGFRFDLTTGRLATHWWNPPSSRARDYSLRSYPVVIRGGEIHIDVTAPNEATRRRSERDTSKRWGD